MKTITKASLARWVNDSKRGQRSQRVVTGKLRIESDSISWDSSPLVTQFGNGMVRLDQPGPGIRSYKVAARIRGLLDDYEVPYFTVTPALLSTAAIVRHTVTVIDQKKAHRFWDLPDTLLAAHVDVGRGYEPRPSFFLAAHDDRDGSYFFCELPPLGEGQEPPSTLAEAFEMLKPEPVRLAEGMGRKVKRQGDMFLVPAKGFRPKGHRRSPGFLLDTNHMGTDVIMVGGTTYVRGAVRHAPSGRDRDHTSVRLGPRWHIAVKNTVPLVR